MLPVLELSQEQKMSIQPQDTYAIPEDTRRVAHAAFPKGNLYMRMRDELGELYHDQQFAELFPRRGQPAESPGRLAWVTVMQFAEGLSDRQAADAARPRAGLAATWRLSTPATTRLCAPSASARSPSAA
jgi:hypothetical protein